MRHRDKINHLGRKYGHRKSMLTNMAVSLIMNHSINTTLAKAKELRTFVEPIITASKDDIKYSEANAADDKAKEFNKNKRMNAHRYCFARLRDKGAVKHLFEEITPKVAERNGGYTRILKTVTRLGDNAKMCYMELVDFNPNYSNAKNKVKASAPKATRRSRKKATKAEGADNAPESKAE
ncbi:MAG: 50S ribosomal protein L17 [Bacteroidales bacterium]|nr:50S ribosomal protein L17 [Bacteroidales bacterium]